MNHEYTQAVNTGCLDISKLWLHGRHTIETYLLQEGEENPYTSIQSKGSVLILQTKANNILEFGLIYVLFGDYILY